jgi:hypothetical protein
MKLQKIERDKDERWRQVAASFEVGLSLFTCVENQSKAHVFEAKWRANQEELEKLVVENKNIKWEVTKSFALIFINVV